jgi:hypothetical protein
MTPTDETWLQAVRSLELRPIGRIGRGAAA